MVHVPIFIPEVDVIFFTKLLDPVGHGVAMDEQGVGGALQALPLCR